MLQKCTVLMIYVAEMYHILCFILQICAIIMIYVAAMFHNYDLCCWDAVTVNVTEIQIMIFITETESYGNWCCWDIFSSSTTWDRSTMNTMFDSTRGSNSRPPIQDCTLHITEMPSPTTRPPVTYHDYGNTDMYSWEINICVSKCTCPCW